MHAPPPGANYVNSDLESSTNDEYQQVNYLFDSDDDDESPSRYLSPVDPQDTYGGTYGGAYGGAYGGRAGYVGAPPGYAGGPGAAAPPPMAPPPVVHKNIDTRMGKSGALVKRLDVQHYGSESTKSNPHRTEGVRYLDAEKRKKYEVTLGAKIIRTHGAGGAVDTLEVAKMYRAGGVKAKPSTMLGAANWGKPRRGGAFSKVPGWKGALIWVALLDKATGEHRFYTHVCKVEKFHHSSFGAGKSVAGAGEWVIVDGHLSLISANSGHYRPDLSLFAQAVRWMTAALHSDTQVVMYDRMADDIVTRPVREFLAEPSGNGQYFVHPNFAP